MEEMSKTPAPFHRSDGHTEPYLLIPCCQKHKPSMLSTAVTAAATASIPIDWKQLHALSDGNEEFEVELLKIFFVETKTQLQVLSRAIHESDLPTIEHLAHKLKGSSGNIGFLGLYQHASLLEHQARSGKLTPNAETAETEQYPKQKHLLDRMVQDLATIQTFLEGQASFSAVVRDTN